MSQTAEERDEDIVEAAAESHANFIEKLDEKEGAKAEKRRANERLEPRHAAKTKEGSTTIAPHGGGRTGPGAPACV